MSAHAARSDTAPPTPAGEQLRIGDVARAVGTTPRTIRYYEQLGLLPTPASRAAGAHRTYSAEEVERLREVMRLKELLGLSLEELGTLLAAEEARAAVRAQLRREDVDPIAGASFCARRSGTSTVSSSSCIAVRASSESSKAS